MIDQWFRQDLKSILDTQSVAVFVDESGEAEFLLRTVGNELTIHRSVSEIDELHIKYLIERGQPSPEKFLIYTSIPKDQLKFVREYCETNGCLEIRYLQNYIKDKVHQTLNLNINLPKDELIAAAKVSVGKDRTYWMDLCHKGAAEIFDLTKELLPFVHDPERYGEEKYDAQLRQTFYRKVNELLKQEYIPKPPQTLANEVVKRMLDGIAYGKPHPTLEAVYRNWLDSMSFQSSFPAYLKKYTVPSDTEIWSVSPFHPFQSIDEQWLKVIGKNIGKKEILQKYLPKVSQRMKSKQTKALGITFWHDVKVLLDFDPQDIAYHSSFAECKEFYTKHFYRLDTAIRNLYTEFLNKRELLEPFQEYYKQVISIFFEKWFTYFAGYKEEQTGILQRIIDENSLKTAVIVGDGVSYEIACQIAEKVNGNLKLTKSSIVADIPSETENNMSRIYVANGLTEKVQSKREKFLRDHNPDTAIDYIHLDEVTEDARPAQFLICTYKDIDAIGEKLQHKALKYFPETIKCFAEKISLLFRSGYSKVYLITDHGFVLTGLLSEAEKISVSLDGLSEKAERYVRTEKRQTALAKGFIEVEKNYENYHYLYFSKTMNPFKTPGAYGFSHGGVSPQELITPYFCWERSGASSKLLKATFENKKDLKSVTGELYQLKIVSDKSAGDLYSMERKVCLVFFSGKVQINKSDIFTIKRDQVVAKEYAFDGNAEIEVQLLDAESKEQIDRVIVKQNKDRDLGGLL